MKASRVYFLVVLLVFSFTLFNTGCARKSGCHDIDKTTKPNTKKKPKASTHLFNKKTRRKMK